MNYIKTLVKNTSRYLDMAFLLKFVIVVTGFYYFNLFFLGITDPKNYYNAFLDNNLNYISWISTSILFGAQLIDRLFHINATISGNNIYVPGGASVLLNYACLGFGIVGFWIAFVVAHKNTLKKKLLWCFSGVAAIWFINCWRIALLLLSLQNQWPGNKYMDHHDMFNIAGYIIILSLMYLYTIKNKENNSDKIGFKQEVHLRNTVVAE